MSLSRRIFLSTAGAAMVMPSVSVASRPLKVVATTAMIADALREVGGKAVDVRALMGPGVDPHSYRQTRSDILALTRADLVAWHGMFLEAQMEEFLLRLAARNRVVALGEAVPDEARIGHDEYEDRHDPHVWMVPELWRHVVTAAERALVDLVPAESIAFGDRAGAYLERLDGLGAYVRSVLATVPERSRVLVTAHDAFQYFGAAYDYDVLGVQGISTNSEAGLQHIEGLVSTIVEREVGAVFVETSVSDRNVRALIEGAAAQGHEVALGGELFSDAMGPDGTYEGTYVGMIDHNATTIARALGGEAPRGGLNGELAGA